MREVWTNEIGEIILVYKNGKAWYGYCGDFDFAASTKDDADFVLRSLGYQQDQE